MADLFIKQSKHYAEGRPDYPQSLFQFIASHTPSHDLAWDVGTGTGQAAKSLASFYKNVIATDTSPTQLEYASKIPNIRYQCTPRVMSMPELQQHIGSESSVDLVTIAQAMHWFDLQTFYHQVRHVLKKPDGVIAAWCYTLPEINPEVDAVVNRFYTASAGPYWESARQLVDEKYETIEFPFEPVDGLKNNGPIRFDIKRPIDLKGLFVYFKSWSSYTRAKGKGVELLTDDVVAEFKTAWNGDETSKKTATYPIYLRIGKVGSAIHCHLNPNPSLLGRLRK